MMYTSGFQLCLLAIPTGLFSWALLIGGGIFLPVFLIWFLFFRKKGNSHIKFQLKKAEDAYSRKDYKTFLDIIEPMAEAGNAEACYRLALHYKSSGSTDYFDLMKSAADKGHTDAMYEMGRHFEYVSRMNSEAREWYHKAAEEGHMQAVNSLCKESNDTDIFRWTTKGADKGDSYGMLKLGYLYMLGKGTPADEEKGLEWFRKAAQTGNAAASMEIGLSMWDKRKDLLDKKKALERFEQAEKMAVESNDYSTLFLLGEMYGMGGVVGPENKVRAQLCFSMLKNNDSWGPQIMEELRAVNNLLIDMSLRMEAADRNVLYAINSKGLGGISSFKNYFQKPDLVAFFKCRYEDVGEPLENWVLQQDGITSHKTEEPKLLSVKKNGKWGWVDVHNRFVIPPEYETGWVMCYDGLMIMQKNGKWGGIYLYDQSIAFKFNYPFPPSRIYKDTYLSYDNNQKCALIKPGDIMLTDYKYAGFLNPVIGRHITYVRKGLFGNEVRGQIDLLTGREVN